MIKRLGQGACSVALLVERDGQDFVLKVASDPEDNAAAPRRGRGAGQAAAPAHRRVLRDTVELGDTRVPDAAGPRRQGRAAIETLGQRLRKEGRLHIDLLQRFGEDLLDVVKYLEEQGIPHRDIKPDNIAVGMVGRGDQLHLVLFDFSLSRTPPENIQAGTNGYLDPFLPLRKPPRGTCTPSGTPPPPRCTRWPPGTLPEWGDGRTDPSHLDCEVTIDAELFDAAPAGDGCTEFFRKALRRDAAERFDNAEEMLRDVAAVLRGHRASPDRCTDHADEEELRGGWRRRPSTRHIHELGLGTRATNALDRANMLTVEDLLDGPDAAAAAAAGRGQQDPPRDRRGGEDPPRAARQRRRRRSRRPAEDDARSSRADDPSKLSVDLLAQRLPRGPARGRAHGQADLITAPARPGARGVARHLAEPGRRRRASWGHPGPRRAGRRQVPGPLGGKGRVTSCRTTSPACSRRPAG